MSIDKNKTLILDFLNAIGSGQFDSAAAMMDDGATYWLLGTTPASGTHGKQSYIDMCKAAWELADGGFNMKFEVIAAEGERVVVEGEGKRKLKNGLSYDQIYLNVFRIRNGKILEAREYLDTEAVTRLFKDLEGDLVVNVTSK